MVVTVGPGRFYLREVGWGGVSVVGCVLVCEYMCNANKPDVDMVRYLKGKRTFTNLRIHGATAAGVLKYSLMIRKGHGG